MIFFILDETQKKQAATGEYRGSRRRRRCEITIYRKRVKSVSCRRQECDMEVRMKKIILESVLRLFSENYASDICEIRQVDGAGRRRPAR